MQGSRIPEALCQAPLAGLRHAQSTTWQQWASAWMGSESSCGQVRTKLGLDTYRHRTRCLGLVQGPCMFRLRTLGPHYGRPGLHTEGSGSHSRGPAWTRGGPGPTLGVWTVYLGVRGQPQGSGLYIRGSGALPWGSGPLLMPWSIAPSLDMWRLWTRPCGGLGRCYGPRIAA
jgi:hypothetical protein